MTNEERAATVRALIEEREGYHRRGEEKRVAEVNEQLRRLGALAAVPVKRAERRVEEPPVRRAERR